MWSLKLAQCVTRDLPKILPEKPGGLGARLQSQAWMCGCVRFSAYFGVFLFSLKDEVLAGGGRGLCVAVLPQSCCLASLPSCRDAPHLVPLGTLTSLHCGFCLDTGFIQLLLFISLHSFFDSPRSSLSILFRLSLPFLAIILSYLFFSKISRSQCFFPVSVAHFPSSEPERWSDPVVLQCSRVLACVAFPAVCVLGEARGCCRWPLCVPSRGLCPSGDLLLPCL